VIGAISADVAENRANWGTKDRDQAGSLGGIDRTRDENPARVAGDVTPVKKRRLDVASGPDITPGSTQWRTREQS
jgi:hypothetical protein